MNPAVSLCPEGTSILASSMRYSCQEVFSFCPSFTIPAACTPKKYNPSAIVCLPSLLNTLAIAGMKNNWRWEHLLALKLAG